MIQLAGAAIVLLLAASCLAAPVRDATAQPIDAIQKQRVTHPTVPHAEKLKGQVRELPQQKNDPNQARRTIGKIQKQKHDDAKKVIENLR